MATCVSLLRAVNLGAHNKVGMADLRLAYEQAGMGDVRTLLHTGNVVFTSKLRSSACERVLEAAVAGRLRLRTDVFVRSASEWTAIVEANPFEEAAALDPSHLVVVCLKAKPTAAAAAALRQAIKGRELIAVIGRTAYITYPDGIGTSKLTMTTIERTLGTAGTGRNWNTVLKLAALAGGM